MTAELEWSEDGPRSLRYDDVYFSRTDGLAESRTVFLQGCGLPDAWAGRDRFTVAELGFGTGLNVAALLELWRRTRPPGGRLSIFSVEAHLLSREEAARALSVWRNELGDVADLLLAAWPDPRIGFHRIDLESHAATLDLYVGEVGDALARWGGAADAWFLDGFSPARNPQMWTGEVLSEVGRLSAPGARVATFTVAGHVRRALSASGLEVERKPGFGSKRQRLEGRLHAAQPAPHAASRPVRSVTIVGGGIAGASLVRAFSRQGVACTLVDMAQAGAGASGNPAALVTPRLDAGFGPAAELHAQAFARAVELYRREAPGGLVARGALQLGGSEREAARFARLAAWAGFPPGGLEPLAEDESAARLDEAPVGLTALSLAEALVVEPAVILEAWVAPARRVHGCVAAVECGGGGWLCRDASGAVLAKADAVCFAAGFDTARLLPGSGLHPVRGQAEFVQADVFTGSAAAWGAYAIPMRKGGVLFGASHLRGDAADDVREADTAANLRTLAARRPALAERIRSLQPGALEARAAIRAATSDHLPLAGETGRPGLYMLSGLGGRGFTLAPLLAEHLAALAVVAPSPLSVDLARRLRPDRFLANPAVAQPLG
ncbi:tRNA (5-methylaminomethyl-2-thiouridine)(34)-methyltransferase MnmD [Caulobacter sp. S45]|uniref:tRNA (5-methylaminomethyl-2-thiouridine)(34)-methyltransferase MnmD n=1 Tax=Caulobacter sp. S45 TaxID=1641861 RepID=UPI001575DCEB|nr:tRNA (5-methylaminomethyl-2-thiouridine)(34)-methyltransferase MnmD [Caulobacter sp. S45]